MKLTTKKIIAREFLLILVSFILCLLAYNLGLILEKQHDNRLQKYESQIDTYLNSFRKNQQVDSLYKLQMDFYTSYKNSFKLEEFDNGNYFFWKNLRKTINDNTFYFTYANDEIVSEIKGGDNANTLRMRNILLDQKVKRSGSWGLYNLENYKLEFKHFALNNLYEKYLSNIEWKNYEALRVEKREFENEITPSANNYLENAIMLCLILIFLLRYLVYSILWSIKILKQKNQ